MKTLKECRMISGLTIPEIAVKIGVDKQKYIMFEEYKEEMSLIEGAAFARATSVNIDNIYFFNPKLKLN